MSLTTKQKENLVGLILLDSMEYALLDCGDFSDIVGNDPELLELRKQVRQATNKIADIAGLSEEDWNRGKV
jgi:hypothetical protein